MTRENKLKAIELLSEHSCNVQMKAIINGTVHSDLIALTESCHNAIKTLFECGYSLTIKDGVMIVDKF